METDEAFDWFLWHDYVGPRSYLIHARVRVCVCVVNAKGDIYSVARTVGAGWYERGA